MSNMPGPVEVAFHRPLRLAVEGLVLAGVGLAATAAVLSVVHDVTDQVPAFTIVAVALAADAVLVWRQVRWAVLITLAAFAGQAVAVVGIVVELARGIADVKTHELQQLGFNPTAGVIINLIYSSVALALFCWFTVRWLAARSMRVLP